MGDCKNGGREWPPDGQPERVRTHDFPDKMLGKVTPYGVFELTADGGGSTSRRTRLWKVELPRLADVTGLRIHVCHFPPGTSAWRKIEHGMFCYSTQNWRGRPLVSHEVIVELIGRTTTTKGLRIQAELTTQRSPIGTKVSDAALDDVRLERATFHGDWNDVITPHAPSK